MSNGHKNMESNGSLFTKSFDTHKFMVYKLQKTLTGEFFYLVRFEQEAELRMDGLHDLAQYIAYWTSPTQQDQINDSRRRSVESAQCFINETASTLPLGDFIKNMIELTEHLTDRDNKTSSGYVWLSCHYGICIGPLHDRIIQIPGVHHSMPMVLDYSWSPMPSGHLIQPHGGGRRSPYHPYSSIKSHHSPLASSSSYPPPFHPRTHYNRPLPSLPLTHETKETPLSMTNTETDAMKPDDSSTASSSSSSAPPAHSATKNPIIAKKHVRSHPPSPLLTTMATTTTTTTTTTNATDDTITTSSTVMPPLTLPKQASSTIHSHVPFTSVEEPLSKDKPSSTSLRQHTATSPVLGTNIGGSQTQSQQQRQDKEDDDDETPSLNKELTIAPNMTPMSSVNAMTLHMIDQVLLTPKPVKADVKQDHHDETDDPEETAGETTDEEEENEEETKKGADSNEKNKPTTKSPVSPIQEDTQDKQELRSIQNKNPLDSKEKKEKEETKDNPIPTRVTTLETTTKIMTTQKKTEIKTSYATTTSKNASLLTTQQQTPMTSKPSVIHVASSITKIKCRGGCGKDFVPARPAQEFCSTSCPGPNMSKHHPWICYFSKDTCRDGDDCEFGHDREKVYCKFCLVHGHSTTECANAAIQCAHCGHFGHFQERVTNEYQQRLLCDGEYRKKNFKIVRNKVNLKFFWIKLGNWPELE